MKNITVEEKKNELGDVIIVVNITIVDTFFFTVRDIVHYKLGLV